MATTKDAGLLGWHEAGTVDGVEPTRLATIQAPRKNGTIIAVYSDGSLAYRWPPSPKWIRSQITVYTGVWHARLGSGETLTPQEFIERHIELGYTRLEGSAE